MTLIETGKAAFSRQVQKILRDDHRTASNRRGIVNGFRIGIGSSEGESAMQALAYPQCGGMQCGVTLRKFEKKWLRARCIRRRLPGTREGGRPGRPLVGSADSIEVCPLGTNVAYVDK